MESFIEISLLRLSLFYPKSKRTHYYSRDNKPINVFDACIIPIPENASIREDTNNKIRSFNIENVSKFGLEINVLETLCTTALLFYSLTWVCYFDLYKSVQNNRFSYNVFYSCPGIPSVFIILFLAWLYYVSLYTLKNHETCMWVGFMLP